MFGGSSTRRKPAGCFAAWPGDSPRALSRKPRSCCRKWFAAFWIAVADKDFASQEKSAVLYSPTVPTPTTKYSMELKQMRRPKMKTRKRWLIVAAAALVLTTTVIVLPQLNWAN